MSDYSLRVYTPVLGSSVFVEDISRPAFGVEPSHLLNGGFWQLPFKIVADPSSPEDVARLLTRFHDWLGYHLEERRDGQVNWEGMICQLDLVYGRVRRRRSLIDPERPLHNAVRVVYSGGTTSWYTDADSIARYGRIEAELAYNSVGATEAANIAQMHLADHAWPDPFPVSISEPAVHPVLEGLACGYWITASWRLASTSIAGSSTVAAELANLINTDCEFLSVGNIAANTFAVTAIDGATPYEQIENLRALGDASLNRYRYWVGPGRLFWYELQSEAPRFRLGLSGVRQTLSGPVLDPRDVRPGLFVDDAWPGNDDFLVDEVVVREGRPEPELRLADLSDSDVYAAAVGK